MGIYLNIVESISNILYLSRRKEKISSKHNEYFSMQFVGNDKKNQHVWNEKAATKWRIKARKKCFEFTRTKSNKWMVEKSPKYLSFVLSFVLSFEKFTLFLWNWNSRLFFVVLFVLGYFIWIWNFLLTSYSHTCCLLKKYWWQPISCLILFSIYKRYTKELHMIRHTLFHSRLHIVLLSAE